LDTPTSGSIVFQRQDLSKAGDTVLTRYRREHVGFVFQFYNLIPSLTARENVALVTDISRDPMPAAEALTWVGLGNRLDHFPSQVPHYDEPTGALHYATVKTVLELFARINIELGSAAWRNSNNAASTKIAARLLRLGNGHIVGEKSSARKLTTAKISW